MIFKYQELKATVPESENFGPALGFDKGICLVIGIHLLPLIDDGKHDDSIAVAADVGCIFFGEKYNKILAHPQSGEDQCMLADMEKLKERAAEWMFIGRRAREKEKA